MKDVLAIIFGLLVLVLIIVVIIWRLIAWGECTTTGGVWIDAGGLPSCTRLG